MLIHHTECDRKLFGTFGAVICGHTNGLTWQN